MKIVAATCLLAFLLVAAIAASSLGAGDASHAYTSRVEPICRSGDRAIGPLLRGTHHMATHGEPIAAGRRFIRASEIFGVTSRRVRGVKPPAADARRIFTWLERLGNVKESLRLLGLALEHRNRLKALNRVGQLREAGTSANQAVRGFHFRYCHIYESRFT